MKLTEINPNFTDAYHDRGFATLLLRQKDSGCLDLSKAGELGHAEAHEAFKEYCNNYRCTAPLLSSSV